MTHRHLPSLAALCCLLAFTFVASPAQGALIGYWEAEGDATATVGTDGTLVNGAGFTTGRYGQGFLFDGTLQQRVEVAGGGGLNNLQEGTISMWVKWDGTQDAACCGGSAGVVISRQQNGVFSNQVLGINMTDPATGGLSWQPYSAGGPAISGGTAVGDGTFRHVAVTYASGSHALYLDGVLQGTSGATGNMRNSAGTPLSIGAWIGDGASYSSSVVDDVAIFDSQLDVTEIQALANGATVTSFTPITGVVATASSELTANNFNRVAGNTVDGVGEGTITPDGNPGQAQGMWLSEGIGFLGGSDTDPEITFDLGSIQAVSEMVIYNYNEFLLNRPELLGRGVDEFELLVSDDGVTFTSLGTRNLAIAPGDATNPGQLFSLNTATRFVRLDILSNHNGTQFPNPNSPTDFGFVGLNEVVFLPATTFIPEPATATLSVLLFGTLMTRRRRAA